MALVLQEGGREGSRCSSDKARSRHSGHFWIQLWRFLLEVAGERCTQKGRVRDLRRGLMNAVGIFQECWMGLFKGSLLSKGRCGLEGNHRIIIPPLLAFSFPTHTHPHHTWIHTHKPSKGTFSAL